MKSYQVSQYIPYIICYVTSMLFSYLGWYLPSGIILAISAIYLYLYCYRKTGNPIDLQALFSLFFVGGQSLACLKLSHLQTNWSIVTWFCFLFAYLFFGFGYEWFGRQKSARFAIVNRNYRFHEPRLFLAIVLLTGISLGCFILEAVLLGFIPLFSSEPHAYSYFHISGIHYFTVTFVLIPPLSVIYWQLGQRQRLLNKALLVVCNMIAIVIPILCVSRFQLITMVLLAVLTFLSTLNEIRLSKIFKYAMILLICLVPMYFYLTIRRNHDIEYLNGIFEMKNNRMPIFITQPYMYIANNYDNFNCLVEQLPAYAWGLKMLFPIWALTGLKFKYPQLIHFPIYVTKEELTTVTLFYDAYYDFGIIGIIVFALICGILCSWLGRLSKKSENPMVHVLYAQTALYVIFSFFTTWLSNPTTWFWYGVTVVILLFVGKTEKFTFK